MWPQLIIVTLLAAIAQGVAGFGFTLLAVSFYLLILRSTDAVQLAIIINFAISAVLVGRLWRSVPRSLWVCLMLGALVGFPVGLWAFARADLAVIEVAVAGVTIAFALAVLVQEGRRSRVRNGADGEIPDGAEGKADGGGFEADGRAAAGEVDYRTLPALATGASAGALTTSLGMPGPPVALYLAALGLDKTTFRALSLSAFGAIQGISLLAQSLVIGIDARVWGIAVVLVPTSALGAVIGHRLCRYVSERLFRRIVIVLLLATGMYLLYRVVGG